MSVREALILLLATPWLLVAVACGQSKSSREAGQPVALDATANVTSLTAPALATVFAAALKATAPSTLAGDDLWALAEAPGAPAAMQAWMAGAAPRTGALPEVLMPEVRSTLRQDPTIQSLLQNQVGQILASIVLRGDQVTSEVKTQVWQRVTQALGLPAATPEAAFDLDGYLFAAAGAPAGGFDVEAETTAWQTVLAAPELWTLPTGTAGVYSDLQAVHLLRLFSEWQYAFGLQATPTDQAFGGLSLALDGTSTLAPFDPRVAGAAPRTITGHYDISYPDVDPLTLALSGKETWTWKAAPVSLKEQAQLWFAAATALHRTRPKNRPAASGLFGDSGLLPDDAYMIPLAFLPGMSALLSGRFIDQNAETIQGSVTLASGGAAGGEASLADLARLIRALGLWHQELNDTTDLQLDDGLNAQVTSGLASLLDALRLATASGIKHADLAPDASASLADVAEGLSAITWAERELLPSPVLHAAIAARMEDYMTSRLAPAVTAGKVTARDVLALASLATELRASGYGGDVGLMAETLATAAGAALDPWGKS